jgi:hypothetical protein
MKTRHEPAVPTRRNFLQTGVRLAAVAAAGPLPVASLLRAAEPARTRPSIGIQVGAVSFVDEGTEKVLDLLQERGAIDTLYLTTFTYGRGLAGRQVPGQAFPDHGAQESDANFFHGGNYATPHAERPEGRGRRPDPLAEVLRDAAGQPGGSRTGRPRYREALNHRVGL